MVVQPSRPADEATAILTIRMPWARESQMREVAETEGVLDTQLREGYGIFVWVAEGTDPSSLRSVLVDKLKLAPRW